MTSVRSAVRFGKQCGRVILAGGQVPTKPAHGSRQGQGKDIIQQLPLQAKQTWGNWFVYLLITSQNRGEWETNPSFPPNPSLLPRLSFTNEFCISYPTMVQGDWEGELWPLHWVSSAPSSPGQHSSHSSSAPVWGPFHDSPPQTSPTWVLPMGYRPSWTALVWVPSTGCAPSGADCSHGVTNPPSKTAPMWAPFSTAPEQPFCVTATFGHLPAVAWGPPWAAGGICSTMDLHGQETACLTMVFTTGCRGNSPLAPGAPPQPPSLTLVSAEFFLSHVPILSWSAVAQLEVFPSLLNTFSQRHCHCH